MDSVRERLSKNAFPIQIPVGLNRASMVVDLVKMKTLMYNEYTDKARTEGEIPAKPELKKRKNIESS